MYYRNVIGFPPAPAQPIVFDILCREVEDAFIAKGYVFLHGRSDSVEGLMAEFSFNSTRRGIEEWLNEMPERKHFVEDRMV